MTTKFFTNREENTLINKFVGVLEYNPNINCFDAVIGYLRASGYFAVRPFLNNMAKIRLLVGINADIFIADAQKRGIVFFADPKQAKEDFLQSVKMDIENANYTKQAEDSILQFVKDIVDKRIEVRAHPGKKIHAKIYLLYPDNFNEHTLDAAVISGSSNLTGNGLGIDNNRQYEFDVLLNDNADVQFAKQEFETLWKEAKGCDILPANIQDTLSATYLSADVSPFDLYIKTLIEYFGDRISYDFSNLYEMPEGFKKMEYQIDAVDEGYKKLLRYDGFFLSDVVGLGKTVIATMIAKRFSIENGLNNTKILVVYPPTVEKNWKTTFDRFGITNAKFIRNGSLEKVLDSDNYNYWNAEEYDLVLVDESHKFRNHETEMFKNLQDICKCPRINPGKIKGWKKKVMLISATPLNNYPEDIYNQILLFQDPRKCTLDGIPNLTAFFSPKTKKYQELRKETPLNIVGIEKLYSEIREKVIKPLTIRRTRTDILNIPRYKKDVNDFPVVQKPDKIGYILNRTQTDLFQYSVEQITEKLKYSRYQAILGLKDDVQKKYYEKAELVSKSLAFIVKTLLVKRLESSFHAFENSLTRFRDANLRMIQMFNNDKIFIAPDLDINKFYEKGLSEEEIEVEINKTQKKNPRNRSFKKSDFKPSFEESLRADQTILDDLCKKWNGQNASSDPKLCIFLEKLNKEMFDSTRNIGQKLVIFSESSDTINYLAKNIKRKDVLTVSAANRDQIYNIIEENFDANIPDNKRKNDYNIILTTDVLAEGINLHRSNVVVNYDTPWNATRLMQRIGRVNRIGSVSKNIYNYVFYPSAQGNAELNLISTSIAKIQSFHTALGNDNQIYSPDEIVNFDVDKLFEVGSPQEEENRELSYLEFLRTYKQKNAKEFLRIEKLNLRSRTGRTKRIAMGIELHNASLVFLKTNELHAFYLVSNGKANELTSLQALEYLKAEKGEQSVPRIAEHHEQVQQAKTVFELAIQEAYNDQTNEVKASGQKMNSAKSFVRQLKSMVDDIDISLKLDHLIKLIEWGTITSITTNIDRLEKKLSKQAITREECLTAIIETANKYDRYFKDEEQKKDTEPPLIILSESFN